MSVNMLGYSVTWLFGGLYGTSTKLPVIVSVYRRATLRKTILARDAIDPYNGNNGYFRLIVFRLVSTHNNIDTLVNQLAALPSTCRNTGGKVYLLYP